MQGIYGKIWLILFRANFPFLNGRIRGPHLPHWQVSKIPTFVRNSFFTLINFYQRYENLSGVITGKEMTFTTMLCNFLKSLILQVSNWFRQMLEWNTVSPPVRTVFPLRPSSSLYGQRLSLDNFTQNKKCGQWPALNPTKKKIWPWPLQRPKKAIYIFFTQSKSTWSIYAAHKGTYSWGKSIWAIGYGSLLYAP